MSFSLLRVSVCVAKNTNTSDTKNCRQKVTIQESYDTSPTILPTAYNLRCCRQYSTGNSEKMPPDMKY